ncbi:MAG TPA: hypothetical protein VEJ36_05965 [Nitrososphaerales archaeon]|nr:hypothetical protein [Nitrososphaerales archaeon]
MTTSTTTVDYTPQYISLIQTFSAIKFSITGTINGTAENSTISYTSTSMGGGIYNVTMTLASSGSTTSATFSIDASNSTVLSATIEGYTVTGSTAKSEFDAFMGLFGLQEYYSGEIGVFTDSSYFHSTGTKTETYGTTSFPVTTWVANSLPESIDFCGVNSDITAYTLSVGTPPGTTLQFITYLNFASSSPSNENITFQLVSMTVA